MSETNVTTTEGQVVDTDDLDAFSNDFFGRKTDDEPATTGEAEQEPVEAGEVEETEAQTEDDAPQVEEEPAAKPVKKTAEDRINELVKQREDAKREGQAALDSLRKEFEEKLAALQPKALVPDASGEPTPADLKEDGTEKYPLGEFDPQYIRDLTRFTLETERNQAAAKAETERKQNEVAQTRQALTNDWNGRVEAAKAEYPDLIEKGQELMQNFNNLPTDYANYLSDVLMQMDKGPDVLYYLSNHPEEAIKIVNSGAQKATLALGRIESRFIEADAQKAQAKPKISKAPEPPAVRARGTNGAFMVSPDTDDLNAFEKSFFSK